MLAERSVSIGARGSHHCGGPADSTLVGVNLGSAKSIRICLKTFRACALRPSIVSLVASLRPSSSRHVSRSRTIPKVQAPKRVSSFSRQQATEMAARVVRVAFGEQRVDVEVDADMGAEVFQIQIYSLTGVEPQNQLLSLPCGSPLDLASPTVDLASLLPSDGSLLLLRDGGEEGTGEEGRKGERGSDDAHAAAPAINAASAATTTTTSGIGGTTSGGSSEAGAMTGVGGAASLSDEELARRLQAEEDAALAQQLQQSEAHAMRTMMAALQQQQQQQQGGGAGRGQAALEGRLMSLWTNVMQYEDPARQTKARSLIPVQRLEECAAVHLAKQGQWWPSEAEFRDAVLRQLLLWFKGWFRWVDSPPCARCATPTCSFATNGTPSLEDLRWGGQRVELHRCKHCGSMARFVRYNDPAKLLDTREGRCGEWANAFTLCCRALGYDARQAVDWTDHVWTEAYSHAKHRWLHLDPCEAAFDTPLLYEQGWGKKLTYVFGVGRDGVADVIRRYTRRWDELKQRRVEASEAAVVAAVAAVTGRARAGVDADERRAWQARDEREREELLGGQGGGRAGGGGEGGAVLGGRETGSLEWRAARGELGEGKGMEDKEGEGSEGKTGGRVEKGMVDAHVGRLLVAVGDMCRDAIGPKAHESEAAAGVQAGVDAILSLLSLLHSLPFRTRHLPLSDHRCHPFRKLLLAAGAATTTSGAASAEAGSSSEQGKPLPSAAALVAFLSAMGVSMWMEGGEGREGTAWIVGVKGGAGGEGERGTVLGAARGEGRVEEGKGGGSGGVGEWRYSEAAARAAMAMQAAQELLPRVKQALVRAEASSGGVDGGEDASWLRCLVHHERVCGARVVADGENAPNEMAVCACDGSLETKWLHHEGGKASGLYHDVSRWSRALPLHLVNEKASALTKYGTLAAGKQCIMNQLSARPRDHDTHLPCSHVACLHMAAECMKWPTNVHAATDQPELAGVSACTPLTILTAVPFTRLNTDRDLIELHLTQEHSDMLRMIHSLAGAWLQYRVDGSAPVSVTAYSITSANDCPERDPCCWSLQSSTDGGTAWRTLDSQSGVRFNNRHQARVFPISPTNQAPASLYRLAISAVRDPSCSCLQLTCFDLFTTRTPVTGSTVDSSSEAGTKPVSFTTPPPAVASPPAAAAAAAAAARERLAEAVREEFRRLVVEEKVPANEAAGRALKHVQERLTQTKQ